MRRGFLSAGLGVVLALAGASARASDHLDTPASIADPRADIGDLYAWIAPDGTRLNLVMTLVGKVFGEDLTYAFHIDSGVVFTRTRARLDVACTFAADKTIDCRTGGLRVKGDAGGPDGLADARGRMRVFAGLRDDPFFNNVRGTRAAYLVADAAIKAGATADAAGCTAFSPAVRDEIARSSRTTDGGRARNFLAGWTSATIVVSLDLKAATRGGDLMAVWASTSGPKGRIDSMGRPLTGNALLGTLASAEQRDAIETAYNQTSPAEHRPFEAEIAKGAALYDGFDGVCGDAFLADGQMPPARRYAALAALLADDRLWLNAAGTGAGELFALERAALAGAFDLERNPGGRHPAEDSIDIWRSLLVDGTTGSVTDGVDGDDAPLSPAFPYLAPPQGELGKTP